MGLIETALDYVSIKSILIILGSILALWMIYAEINDNIRLRRLGARGSTRIKSVLPFGLDVIYEQIKSTMKHKNYEVFVKLLNNAPFYTAEGRLLRRHIVMTADPENIKAILATQFADFGKGEQFHKEWNEFLGDSIFATDGHLWHGSRQLLRPQFSRERISDLHCFESHLETFFKAIANGGVLNGEEQVVDVEAGNGKPFDISELLFRYTLDVATDFLLGMDTQSLTTPRQPFADAFNEVQRVQNIIARAGPLRHLVPMASFRAGLKVVNEFCNLYIERALRLSPEELASKTKSDSGYTFLHELASFTRDRKVLRDQVIAVLLAGRDTTAATLSFVFYELGRHPEFVRKLRREIEGQVGWHRTPTYEDLKSMKYVQNVINETLRLYPAVPFNVRTALKDTTLPRGGGPDGSLPLAVLKDTAIAYSTLTMQRRPDLYPSSSPFSEKSELADPQTFNPDRWTNWQPKPWQYIPFNGGPRICIGQQFALTEMAYVLTRIFQRYERVESFMVGEPKLKAEIVIQPGDGVTVALWEARKGE
ncbi:cytochrome P450 52A11 [Annulohypoxylon maeteangense]|uniref:cytochrome P450 52A11 n=1 Tax=Annulohypoxylon maeteangense TaxID=1927788 RepID=UPI00200824BC|nr:cytochrome P450 52A11 [Annulohypoxylon maeteangense]KAI0890726.1 cytochrome P450 52A11 [Annulohypoxylon maeteangense]